jgi:uncharacterized protein YecT (DUF1311 family)
MRPVRVFRCMFCFVLLFVAPLARPQSLSYGQLKDLRPEEFTWLLEFSGKPVTAVIADARFAALRDRPLSVLKAKFDLGDPPGGKTLVRDEILDSLKGVPDPVQTRLGRYVLLSGCRTALCNDRALVWIDTPRGLVLSVLLVPASADVPGTTPNMLIASRQLDAKRLEPNELPARFWVDWQEWAYERHLPEVMMERIVNTYGGTSVLFHDDQEMCDDAESNRDTIGCGGSASTAADADLSALLAQLRNKFEAGSPDREALDKGQALWIAYRESTCSASRQLWDGGSGAPAAYLECERMLTHDRVRNLNEIYFIPLYD